MDVEIIQEDQGAENEPSKACPFLWFCFTRSDLQKHPRVSSQGALGGLILSGKETLVPPASDRG